MENSISSNNSIESNSSWELYIDQFMLLSEGKAVNPSNPDHLKPNYSRGDTSYLLKEYLGFKKRRRGRDQTQLDDDSLEDTASSPVDFSKVKDLYNLRSPTKKKDDAGMIFQMKANVMIPDSRKHVMDIETHHEVSNNANEIKSGCNALRKRGLCLVPLSMLIDFLS